MISSRIAINVLLFISILYFPWWATIAISILLLTLHTGVELLFWGVFADALYGTKLIYFYDIQYLFTLTFFIMIFLALNIKKKIIFYT